MDALAFGTAGIPWSAKGSGTEAGIREVRRLGLGAMELEFVQSVNISAEKAPLIRKAAEGEGIVLTCHAPYYINLNAREPEKLQASISRLLNSARVLEACGGWSVAFHAGYYMGMPSPAVSDRVQEAVEAVVEQLKTEGNGVWIRPEIGGKTTAWGSLEEILALCQQLDHVLPCIDWAHLHARSLGKNNSYAEFSAVLEAVEKALGKDATRNLHCHVEGIEIGKTGERCHRDLQQTDYRYGELMAALKDFGARGVIISESPNIEQDALLLKKTYEGG